MNHVFELCLLFIGVCLLFFSNHPPDYGLVIVLVAVLFAGVRRIISQMMKEM